jgi:hypothetical protein
MSIIASEILYKTSTTAGAAGNANAQSTPGNSLGKYISTTTITDATLNNLFPDITGDENAASNADYQCYFVHNNNASLTWTGPVAWLSAEVAGGATASIWPDSTAASALGSATAQALTIANKNTAPAASSFSAPTTKATGLALGNIPNGQVKGIWVKRLAANTAAVSNDGVTIRCEGDTL